MRRRRFLDRTPPVGALPREAESALAALVEQMTLAARRAWLCDLGAASQVRRAYRQGGGITLDEVVRPGRLSDAERAAVAAGITEAEHLAAEWMGRWRRPGDPAWLPSVERDLVERGLDANTVESWMRDLHLVSPGWCSEEYLMQALGGIAHQLGFAPTWGRFAQALAAPLATDVTGMPKAPIRDGFGAFE